MSAAQPVRPGTSATATVLALRQSLTMTLGEIAERAGAADHARARARMCRRLGQNFAALELETLAIEIDRGAHRKPAVT
jgi:hypothetical protein